MVSPPWWCQVRFVIDIALIYNGSIANQKCAEGGREGEGGIEVSGRRGEIEFFKQMTYYVWSETFYVVSKPCFVWNWTPLIMKLNILRMWRNVFRIEQNVLRNEKNVIRMELNA